MNLRCRLCFCLLGSVLLVSPSAAQEAETLEEALAKGDATVNLRYRYEIVDDVAFDKDAYASTLRTALGYRTLPYRGFSLFVQAQNVAVIGADRFDNRGAGPRANDVSDRPAVVDPAGTRMQQVYLRVDAFHTTFDVGRREIAYGDHRFIGDVNWRQNHQAFDAVYVTNRSLAKTTLSYTFAARVIRIDGGVKDMMSHFLNAFVELDPDLSLELFGYLLDYTHAADARLSSQSYGAKLAGSRSIRGNDRVLFEAEYAKQMDLGANPTNRNADYLHLVGGVRLPGKATVKVGRELLGGSAARGAFQTPLSTLFKFNGWADKFLTTPPEGLLDWYVSGEGQLGPLTWTLVYHDFRADEGGTRYGTELDARSVVTTPWKQTFGFQVALYRADTLSSDAGKVWFWTEYGF